MDSRINQNIIEANIKLQDENKIVKNDNEILKKRMNNAAQYLKERMPKFKVFDLEKDIQDAIDMLEGNYIYDDMTIAKARRTKKGVL